MFCLCNITAKIRPTDACFKPASKKKKLTEKTYLTIKELGHASLSEPNKLPRPKLKFKMEVYLLGGLFIILNYVFPRGFIS